MRPIFYFALLLPVLGQAPVKPVAGTVESIDAPALTIRVKPDAGESVTVAFGPETVFQRVAPGERDLRKAQPAKPTELAVGDRILAGFTADTPLARRILIMSATEIAQRQELDRRDWTQRGVGGVVTAKTGGEITLRSRAGATEVVAKVVCHEKTEIKRYAPDSVKFSAAVPSTVAEIKIGDQVRAKGTKSADGSRVEAEALVFGTFLTRAGTVTAVDTAGGFVSVKDLETNKPFVVRVSADSQLKTMPQFPMMGGGGMPGGGGPPAGGGGPGPGAGGPRAGMDSMPDPAQMIERMPVVTIDKIAVGQTVVVSSTKGAKADELTAIILLSNADMLIRMATMGQQNRGAQGGMGQGMGMGGGMGLGGLDLSGMMP